MATSGDGAAASSAGAGAAASGTTTSEVTSAEDIAPQRLHILLGVTGSVATVKFAELAVALSKVGEVKVVATKASQHMMGVASDYAPERVATFEASGIPVLTDEDEWKDYGKVGRDPVLHVELRKWADVVLIAPLSANTLAKISNGMCDNLLTCVCRVYEPEKPIVVAPAMNTSMWSHPLTAKQLKVLTDELGVTVVSPVSKLLACGDLGVGAMANVDTIVKVTASVLGPKAEALADAAGPA